MLRSLVGSEMCIRDSFPSGVGEDGRTQPASPCGPNSSILLSTTSGPHWKHRVVPPVFLTPLQAPTGSRPFDSTDEENDDEEEDTTTTTITRRTSTKTDRLTTIDDEEDEGNNVEEPLPQQVVGINQLEIPAFPEALESLESGFCGVCLLYTSDAADEEDSVDLGGRRIIKKKKNNVHVKERIYK
eukprot:TRINITY_DN13014_c0_g1_i3.p1 TRINITY_DN13014_c0_g1~~TRINITY_DN13014_c0_g1_i3.p1  ORF type:complete len:185 (-),score=45.47 TRINITY_DN13014_c0_g1_i3:63-617(-)